MYNMEINSKGKKVEFSLNISKLLEYLQAYLNN
jgi:hypothetical protein